MLKFSNLWDFPYYTVLCGSVSTVRRSQYRSRLLLVTGTSPHNCLLTVVLVVSGEVFVVSASVVEVVGDEEVSAENVVSLFVSVCSVLEVSAVVVA